MRAALLLLPFSLGLSLGAACLRQTEYHCTSNNQCGAGGTCQVVGSVGYCAFADSECGQRFGDSAGPYANKCVGEQGGDAGIDTPPAATCPVEYMALPNDAANPHRYRRAPQNLNWDAQRAFCTSTSPKAYLAVPDSVVELTGLYMLAGNTSFWVGIDDRTTEGMFVLASGGPAPATLPWANGQPDNAGGGGGQDCVAGTATTISDEDCTGGNANRPAVCECVP
jgi:hypothetical protein